MLSVSCCASDQTGGGAAPVNRSSATPVQTRPHLAELIVGCHIAEAIASDCAFCEKLAAECELCLADRDKVGERQVGIEVADAVDQVCYYEDRRQASYAPPRSDWERRR